jgi:small subunit ribosomal protein S1
MNESFAELFEESLAKTEMRPGTLLKAKVVDITPDAVIVDAGLKSEGIIPKWQFLDERGQLEVQIGDEVEVALDLVEDGLGSTLLSRDKAKRLRAWEKLEEAYEKGELVASPAKCAAALRWKLVPYALFCPDLWWMCVRFEIPVISKARSWSSR